ncbi:MAG TPA: DegT/DnrJ/EryC1/StrS family aminotransferase [Thermodesulfobacteriota bacterium]|nr:DegT/DnrJ/EryC1/StrS family aminotransferase [Thermodesulfobacteriota bacterium]
MKMKVPLLDLKKQYGKIRSKIDAEIRKVLESQQFILGPAVEALEREIAAYCKVPHAVGVASGTDALLLSLMALGVKAGDRVITASFTFFATGGSISRLGAVPVFIDVDPVTYNLDPNKLEDYLRKVHREEHRPTVLLPVHLFGQMADMEALMEVSRRYGLRVVEDGAQALGARQKSNSRAHGDGPPKEWMAGAVGDLGCFSFFPSKNLGAFGDAGMVVTHDAELAEKVRILRGHGATSRYYHRVIGINSRLDSLQAAVLRVKLKYLDRWTEGRRRNADRYRALFQEFNLGLPFVSIPLARKGLFHIYNQFVIRARRRDALREYLKEREIGSEIYYPVPLHLQECYRYLGYRPGDLPESERAAGEVLALPIYPELTMAQQRQVARAIASFYSPQRTRSKRKKAEG